MGKYIQKEGGPMGLELTGAVSRVFMLWDKQLLDKVRELTERAERMESVLLST